MDKNKIDTALIVLRLAVGIIFIISGYGKLFGDPGPEATAAAFQGLGIPFSDFFVYVVGLIELLGGIAVLVGFWTEVAAFLLAVVMLVAFIMAKGVSLPAGSVNIALFAINIALMLTGPGSYVLVKNTKTDDQFSSSVQSTDSHASLNQE